MTEAGITRIPGEETDMLGQILSSNVLDPKSVKSCSSATRNDEPGGGTVREKGNPEIRRIPWMTTDGRSIRVPESWPDRLGRDAIDRNRPKTARPAIRRPPKRRSSSSAPLLRGGNDELR